MVIWSKPAKHDLRKIHDFHAGYGFAIRNLLPMGFVIPAFKNKGIINPGGSTLRVTNPQRAFFY